MRTTSTLILLLITAIAFSQPTSHSAYFVANEGQWPGEFAFRYDGGGGSWFVTKDGLTIDLKQYQVSPQNGLPFGGTEGGYSNLDPFGEREPEPCMVKGHALKVGLVNGNQDAVIEGADKLTSYSNYFLGQDKSKWRSRVGHYRKVVAQDVWPGIDVEYRAEPQGVEMVFRVQPGADIGHIQVAYEGLDAPLSVDNKGNLVLKTSLGNLLEQAPFAYQIDHRRQREVPIRYALTESGYRFSADSYDPNRELVIDPLVYSSFVGPGGANDMCLDFNGNIILAGATESPAYPTTVGAYQTNIAGMVDGIVSKFSSDGHELLFSTYIGGSQRESFYACANDLQNQIHVGGFCQYGEYPLTENAYDTTYVGYNEATHSVISEDGTDLLYSSYLGGRGSDWTYDVIIDSTSGEVYVLGSGSPDFITTSDAIYPESTGNGGMIVIYNPESHCVVYVTYFPTDVVNSSIYINTGEVIGYRHLWIAGRVYPTPNAPIFPITENALQTASVDPLQSDGFFSLLDLGNNDLEYSSYFGSYGSDQVFSIDSYSENGIILSGETWSYAGNEFPFCETGFDTVIQIREAYVSVIELPNTVLYGTCLGGSEPDFLTSMKCQSFNSIVISGITWSPDFPVTPTADDTTLSSGEPEPFEDAFIARFSWDLTELEYSTYIGGTGMEYLSGIYFLAQDTFWTAGYSSSPNFPVTADAYQPSYVGFSPVLCKMALPSAESIASSPPCIPSDMHLKIYPNPFNPATTISFSLPRQAQTSLEIFNVLGQAVYTIDLGQLPAGEYRHLLDTANLPSGMYLTRLNAGDAQEVKKMAVVR